MINIPALIANGTIGGRPNRSGQKVVVKKPKGLWYWMVVAPVKYLMLLVAGMIFVSFALTIGLIICIPWLIVRTVQGKSPKPDFITNMKAKTKSK